MMHDIPTVADWAMSAADNAERTARNAQRTASEALNVENTNRIKIGLLHEDIVKLFKEIRDLRRRVEELEDQ